jgi:hypothetical protein
VLTNSHVINGHHEARLTDSEGRTREAPDREDRIPICATAGDGGAVTASVCLVI